MLRKDIRKDQEGNGSTADPEQVSRFDALAEEWWRPDGKFKPVHRFNNARVNYLSRVLPQMFGRSPDASRPLKGLRLADIGCGAGLVSEPMAQLGARTVGIDAAMQNVGIARRHAAGLPDAESLQLEYRHALPEDLEAEHKAFDIVLSLEVVEHVADARAFLDACALLVAPGGVLVVGTLNRTFRSRLLAIHMAEKVLGWLPKGTHDWDRFVTPDEIADAVAAHGLEQRSICGIVFNPLLWQWEISRDTGVNFLAFYQDK